MRLYEVEVIANGSWWTWTVWAISKQIAIAAVEAAHPGVDFVDDTWTANEVEALIVKTPAIFEPPARGGER